MILPEGRFNLLRVGLLVTLIILAGRIFVHGVAGYYLPYAVEGDEAAIDSVISWQASNSKGAYLKAKLLEHDQPRQAESLLYQSLRDNPLDVRPLAVLARIFSKRDDVEVADDMMLLASRKMPANKSLHLRAANYWIERQNLGNALHEWHMALSIAPDLGKQLFPVFIRVIENEGVRQYLLPYATSRPRWWESFFTYTAANARDHSIVSMLYTMSSQSDIPLTNKERHFLIQRYIKDKQWTQAYLIWAEGLSASQRRSLASVYDGSFELGSNNESFGWYIVPSRYTRTHIRRTYGTDGQSALVVKFDNEERPYSNLYQYLLLPPGEYQFTATKRTEKLMGRGRLKWFVRCADSKQDIIGQSRTILPSMEWEPMRFNFHIPAARTCAAQILRLETVGKHPFDHKLSGEIWMDNIRIDRIRVAAGG